MNDIEEVKRTFKPIINDEGKLLVFSLEKYLDDIGVTLDEWVTQCKDYIPSGITPWEYKCSGVAVGLVNPEEVSSLSNHICIVGNNTFDISPDWCKYV